MYQYRQNTNNTLEKIGKLLVVVGAILGAIAFVLVLTRKCNNSESFGSTHYAGWGSWKYGNRDKISYNNASNLLMTSMPVIENFDSTSLSDNEG